MIEKGKVWLVETGDYEGRYVVGIYDSNESAIKGVREIYSSPYIVAWEMVEERLVGHFEEVDGWSIKHTAYFDIESVMVLGSD